MTGPSSVESPYWHKADAARCPTRVRNALKSRHRARSCGIVMRLPRLDQDILSGVPMSLKRLPEGKSPSRMSSPFCKNIFVFLCRKSLHRPSLSRTRKRGVSRSSRTLGGGCDGRRRRVDEGAWLRTAKSCGPDTPTLVSSFAEVSARRRWQQSPVTGEQL